MAAAVACDASRLSPTISFMLSVVDLMSGVPLGENGCVLRGWPILDSWLMLAFAGPEPADGALKAFTERTITAPAILARELAAVREQGWAEAVGEREPDLAALAAAAQLSRALGAPGG